MRDPIEYEDEFIQFLRHTRHLSEAAVSNAVSRCRRINDEEENIDKNFERDELVSLLEKFEYSADDARVNQSPRHSIKIKGDTRSGTASLRNALVLYRDFRLSKRGVGSEGVQIFSPLNSPRTAMRKRPVSHWPKWDRPTEDDLLALASTTTKYVRFLSPDIVEAIVLDNERNRPAFQEMLAIRGISPDLYLWSGSACAFPGVRRHSGTDEINQFRNRNRENWFKKPNGALALDDNSYPKQIWAFAFTGRRFSNKGPEGYSLAHLFDHKGEDRFFEEAPYTGFGTDRQALPGLFTSASNTIYICDSLMKPTDKCEPLRKLLQRKAAALYNGICSILPPTRDLANNEDRRWEIEEFEWAEPVGSIEHIDAFLSWRAKELERLAQLYPVNEIQA